MAPARSDVMATPSIATALARERWTSARWRGIGIAAVLSLGYAALVVLRRPETFTQPQLYAEDGQSWFADAHNLPLLQALITPLGGYITLFQHLVGIVVAPLGLTRTAFAFAIIATVVQVTPALMFASPRLRNLVASDAARVAIAAIYVLIPNAELTGNLTNTQWHLAALAFLVLVAAPPRTRWGRVFDLAVLTMTGLTGPYAVFLLPLGLLLHRSQLDRWRRIELAILALTACVQLGVLLGAMHHVARTSGALDVSIPNFVRIFANQMLMRGTRLSISNAGLSLAIAIDVGIIILLVGGLRRGPRSLRYFIWFALAVVASGLAVPYGRTLDNRPIWDVVATGGGDSRYFFFLALAVVLSAMALFRGRSLPRLPLSWGAALVFAVVLAGAVGNWRYGPLKAEHLDRYQAIIDHAPPGTVVTIPIDPRGWRMQVVVRS